MIKQIKSLQKILLFNTLFILLIGNYTQAQVNTLCKNFEDLIFTLPIENLSVFCQVKNIDFLASEMGVILNADTVTVTTLPLNNNILIPGVLINFDVGLGSISEEDTCESSNIQLFYEIVFSGRTLQCPVTKTICNGEETFISTSSLGVVPPLPDASPWYREYILTDANGTIVYQGNSNSIKVSPETTTSYTLTWNDNLSIPPTGIGYFSIEVENCDGETDLEGITLLYPIVIDDQNPTGISASWYNNGLGFVSSADFVLEINGAIVETQNWEGDSEMTISFEPYSFEADLSNEIRIWSENPGGITDLNLLNDTTSYTYPAYEAQPDLALSQFIQPTLPLTAQSSTIEVLVESFGNVFVSEFTINWTLNGEDQMPFTVENANWTNGESTSDVGMNVVFETANFDPSIDNSIVAWITLPIGQTDIIQIMIK